MSVVRIYIYIYIYRNFSMPVVRLVGLAPTRPISYQYSNSDCSSGIVGRFSINSS